MEKTIKINNLEVKCEALIEFTSLANVLLELVKKQKEMEKKLNDHDIKIKNIKNIIASKGDDHLGWQEKEKEISNILKDDYDNNINNNYNDNNDDNDSNNFNNYNNNNLNDDFNNDLNNGMTKEELYKDNNNTDNEINLYNNNKGEEEESNNDNKEKQKQKENELETEKNIPNFTETNKINIIGNQSSNKEKEKDNEKDKDKELFSKNITSLDNNLENGSVNNTPSINKNTSELATRTFKKVVILEKKVNDLITKAGEHAILLKNIQNNRQAINENIKNIKNTNESIKKLKNDLEKMKEKLQDFNIFDMFKDSGDGNIDMAKGMVMALESKMKKRMDLLDEKYKVLSNENFKNKGDLQNISNLVDSSKVLIDKNTKKIEDIINNEKDKDIKNNEQKEKDNTDLDNKFKEMTKNIKNLENNTNNKLKELEENIKNYVKNTNTGDIKPVKIKKNDNEFSNIIREMNEKIIELEKNVKHIFKKFNIDEINNNLSVLQKEIIKKGNQGAIDDLSDRIYIIDELMKEINSKCDSFTVITQKNTEDNSLLLKKIEALTSQIHRMNINVNRGPKEEKQVIDFTKYIDLNTFDDNKKETNRKFDKIRISFEDILRNIEEILNRLSHTPSDKDFSQFQGVIKNMIDELKLSCNKKYSDKYETIKNIKFLETQIKSINEQYIRKAEGQDNWLLAKKPMSNNICASCEGIIRGELDKRCDYIPWNKYPNREERYTRMGHGFSHMLQLVNDDIRKNVDNKEKSKEKDKNNEKEYNSDEDRKKMVSDKASLINTSVNVKLPKVRQRPKNINNLNILDDALLDKVGGSPYDNNDKNQSILENNNGPQIIKISKLKKITTKKSFQETSINDEHSHRGGNLNIKTFPSDLPSFEKKQGDFE